MVLHLLGLLWDGNIVLFSLKESPQIKCFPFFQIKIVLMKSIWRKISVKDIQDLCVENYKILVKDLKAERTENANHVHAS